MCSSAVERGDDLFDRVPGRFGDDVGFVEQAPQFILQGLGCHHIDPVGIRPGRHAAIGRHLFAFLGGNDLLGHCLEFAEPGVPERAPQRVERGGGGLFKVQLTGQQLDIGGGNIGLGDLQVKVGRWPRIFAPAPSPTTRSLDANLLLRPITRNPESEAVSS